MVWRTERAEINSNCSHLGRLPGGGAVLFKDYVVLSNKNLITASWLRVQGTLLAFRLPASLCTSPPKRAFFHEPSTDGQV